MIGTHHGELTADQFPAISIVIAHGRREMEQCINSLRNQTYPSSRFEVLLLSEDGRTSHTIPAHFRAVKTGTNCPSRARNIGVEMAKGSFIALLDDDTEVPHDWIENNVKILLKTGADFVAGPNIGFPNQTLPEKISDNLLKTSISSGMRVKFKHGFEGYCGARNFSFCNLFFKKELFQKLGGIKEEIGYVGEDTEFLHRAEKAKCSFYFSSDVFVFHKRRNFPIGHLQQMWRWGRDNTRILFYHPDLFWRIDICSALLNPLLLVFLFLFPKIFLALFAFGFAIASFIIIREDKTKFSLITALAFPLHIGAYHLGVLMTLASAILQLFKPFRKKS